MQIQRKVKGHNFGEENSGLFILLCEPLGGKESHNLVITFDS